MVVRNKKISGVIIAFILISLIAVSQSLFSAPAKSGKSSENIAASDVSRKVPEAKEQLYFSFSPVAKKVLPVVVQINTKEIVEQSVFRNPFDFFFRNQPQQDDKREYTRPGMGSGVIVKQDGRKIYVLTNNHVAEKAKDIKIKLNDGREFDAKIAGNDRRTDLALVVFETSEKIPIAVLGDSDDLEVGDLVLAVGNPFGFESTVTMGIVSALGRHAMANVAGFTDYIQTDASINPGNSGGALVNMKGEIIGINTWIASQSGGSVGIGFAIPINNAKKAIDDFITTGRVTYGWLGVSIGDVPKEGDSDLRKALGIEGKKGAFIYSLFKKSPADKSGLFPGDYITKAGDTDIENADHLTKIIGRLSPGTTMLFKLIRDKKETTVSVKIEKRAEEVEIEKNRDLWPGIIVISLTNETKKDLKIESSSDGVLIASVVPDSAAAVAGFKQGDIVQEINDIKVANVQQFYSALNKGSNKKIFQLERQGSSIVIGLVK